jgi:hypothetical protein
MCNEKNKDKLRSVWNLENLFRDEKTIGLSDYFQIQRGN